MKKFLAVIVVLNIVFSCKNEEKQLGAEEKGYELSGTIKNVSDSTLIRLSANNETLDSTYLIGEKFQFKGRLEEPTNVYLMVDKSQDYTAFWMENSEMTFEAEKGKFRESKFTGSETEKENQKLNARINPLRNSMDSIQNLISAETGKTPRRDSLSVEFRNLLDRETEVYKSFVTENPNSLVSAHLLNIFKTTWGKQETQQLYAAMSADLQQTQNGKLIKKYIELNQNPQVGEQYVDLAQANVNGEQVRISDVKGKYTLIEFWASWCGPCRMTNPELVRNYEKYKSQGFEIYAISMDQHRKSWEKAIKDDGLTWTNVSDLQGNNNEAGLIYGINGIPDNFLIDEHGTIIARDLRGENFTRELEKLFGKAEVATAK